MKKTFIKQITWYLVVAMFVIGVTPRVYAGFSPSEVVGIPSADRAADLKKIQKAIETKMISERLKQIGLAPEEIQKRLGQLSDQQIHQLALHLDQLKVAGGSGWTVLGVIIVLAAIAVLIIYLSGHEVVVR
ncbi:MAG: PA2779 family protein [Thermodesulfobacteriota bacterium]